MKIAVSVHSLPYQQGFILRGLYFLLSALFHLLVFLAALVALLPFWLPYAADYKTTVEKEFSQLIGQTVEIERVTLDMSMWPPRWVFEQVKIYDAAQKEQVNLRIGRFYFDLSFEESMRTQSIQPAAVYVEGVELTVIREQDGRVNVQGLTFPLPGFYNLNDPSIQRQIALEIRLQQSKMLWIDRINQREYPLHDIALDIYLGIDELELEGTLFLPDELGGKVVLNADIEGNLEEVEGWAGQINLYTEPLHVRLLPDALQKNLALKYGHLALDIESEWRKGFIHTLKGEAVVQQLRFAPMEGQRKKKLSFKDKPVESLYIQGLWQRWDGYWLAQLSVSEHKQAKASDITRIGLRGVLDNKHYHLVATLNRLQLKPYLAVLEKQPWLTQTLRQHLHTVKPSAVLHDVGISMYFADGEAVPFEVEAGGNIHALSWQQSETIPSVENVSAEFRLRADHGELTLNMEPGQIVYDAWFDVPISVEQLALKLNWKKRAQGWLWQLEQFDFVNQDLKLSGNGRVKSTKDTFDLDLTMDFSSQRRLDNVRDYLPAILPDDAENWLKDAIEFADVPRGKLRFKGNPNDFPFTHDQGLFSIEFDVEGGRLRYLPEWPAVDIVQGRVHFENEHFYADVSRAQSLNERQVSARVDIRDYNHADVLELVLNIEGELSEHFRFLRATPLMEENNALENINFEGLADLALTLDVPLSEDDDEVGLSGKLNLKHNTIHFKHQDLWLDDVQGVISFDANGVTAKEVLIAYRGVPIRLSARTDEEYKIHLYGTAQTALPAVLPETLLFLEPYLQGETDVDVRLELPSWAASDEAQQQPLSLQLRSSGLGLETPLPEPFAKLKTQPRDLLLLLDLPAIEESPDTVSALTGYLEWGDVLKVMFALADEEADAEGFYSDSFVHIALGADDLEDVNTEGLSITGRLETFDVQAWLDFLHQQKQKNHTVSSEVKQTPTVAMENTPNSLAFKGMALEVEQLNWNDWALKGARLQLNPTEKEWQLRVYDSVPQTRVDVRIPKHFSQQEIWHIYLNQLDLGAIAGKEDDKEENLTDESIQEFEADESAKALQKAPQLNLRCQNCGWKGVHLNEVQIVMRRRDDVMFIPTLSVDAEHFNVSAEGGWYPLLSSEDEVLGSYTELVLHVFVPSLGDLLICLDTDIGLREAETELEGRLSWTGAPWAMKPELLQGKLRLAMKKGVLEEIDPGAGRLLGLLNFSRLPHNLVTNFEDLSSKGVAFDEAKGHFALENGILTTEDAYLKGTLMMVGITGSTDLAQQQHDQLITVVPNVKSTLPIVGALLGGIEVGAIALLLDTISNRTEQTGRELSEVEGIRYRVTGDWEQPNIEPLDNQEIFPDDGDF